jgi:hypothetical protein
VSKTTIPSSFFMAILLFAGPAQPTSRIWNCKAALTCANLLSLMHIAPSIFSAAAGSMFASWQPQLRFGGAKPPTSWLQMGQGKQSSSNMEQEDSMTNHNSFQ